MTKSKRNRRTKAQIRKIRNAALQIVRKQGKITLSQLVVGHGTTLAVRDTASDRHLLRRQLAVLAGSGAIRFNREGRDLVAQSEARMGGVAPSEALAHGAFRAEVTGTIPVKPELDAIRAYAGQLEVLGQILNQQIARLVRMIRQT